MKNSWLWLALISLAVAGCEQNPYPNDGVLSAVAPPQARVIPPPYGLSAPDRAYFVEGQPGSVPLVVSVPSPDTPNLVLDGLPDGAVWDPDHSVITWTPNFLDGDSTTGTSHEYPITLHLDNGNRAKGEVVDHMTFVVTNSLQPLQLIAPASVSVTEEQVASGTIQVKSTDFPAGPFVVSSTSDIAADIKIVRDSGDPSLFHWTFLAHADVVKGTQFGSSTPSPVVGGLHWVATGPQGSQVVGTSQVTVNNTWTGPVVMGPTELMLGPDLTFTWVVADLNGQVNPVLDGSLNVPYGTITSTHTNGTRDDFGRMLPSAVYEFKWTGVPEANAGTTVNVPIKFCAQYSYFGNVCSTTIAHVHILSSSAQGGTP